MPISPVSSILRAAVKRDKLNILTFPTHERYETGLAKTGHNFYAYQANGIKEWNSVYGPLPTNYHLLNKELGEKQIPIHIDFDLVLSQNKFGQFQVAEQIARQLHLPLVSLEHTLPFPGWSEEYKSALTVLHGDINVFISDYSVGKWGFKDQTVVRHCVDTDMFQPSDVDRKARVLSVVNDWVNRDWCCGFKLWQRVTEGLPVHPVGASPGLSEAAPSMDALVREYQESLVFINTSTVSPVPTAMLEAMACGCAVVSTDNCMIPEIIEHGVNGFMTNDEAEMRGYVEQLLVDTALAEEMGKKARETILEKCDKDRFVNEWNTIFERATQVVVNGTR